MSGSESLLVDTAAQIGNVRRGHIRRFIQVPGRGIEIAMVKIAEINQIPRGTGKVVQVGGKAIALFNINGTFYALDNVCAHRGGPLGEGKVNGTVVTCPWHGNQFDVTTGQVVTGTQPVTTYAIQTQGDDVLIELS